MSYSMTVLLSLTILGVVIEKRRVYDVAVDVKERRKYLCRNWYPGPVKG